MNKNSPQSVVFSRFRVISILLIIVNITACVSNEKSISDPFDAIALVCKTAAHYQHQVIGNGQCVSFIKQCSGAPQTKFWSPGAPVLTTSPHPGTVIATFENGRYPNKNAYHAAIYIKQDQQGIWVWDQWVGKPVHKRLIRVRYDNADPSNTAQAYRVVMIDKHK